VSRFLLDTHIFLWYIPADSRLPASFQAAIQDSSNDVYLSAVSVWEAVIKHNLGKLSLPRTPAEYLPQQRAAHGINLVCLAAFHRDPFDRLLVAQATQHELTLTTVDAEIAAYPVNQLATL
jgi:PIN domain nuclease of toxin-antitoxin system